MTPAEMPGFPDPIEVVARGYDRIAERYAEWARDEVDDTVAPAYLRLLIERLPRGAAVRDLGCGGGQRLAQLAEHFEITAVDISHEQVRRARRAVPQARVLLGDMTRLEFPSSSFDAVTAFYALRTWRMASSRLCSCASPSGCGRGRLGCNSRHEAGAAVLRKEGISRPAGARGRTRCPPGRPARSTAHRPARRPPDELPKPAAAGAPRLGRSRPGSRRCAGGS